MSNYSSYIIPASLALIVLFGYIRDVKVFDCFLEGAKEGLQTAARLLPALMALVLAVSMLRASGGLDVIVKLLSPAARLTGIPEEVMPLTVLSPISGSGSLTMFESILKTYGADSFAGRVASVIMGSTETTFYAVTVYFGSVGIKKTRCTVPAALLGDMTGYICAAFAVTVFFGR